ncbi:MAG TPA: polyketide synthase dehydratase domain-containing protein, partial [Dermatophilaceae bacterium]|nr:polyketide synthase dehydratase domain-containing protein [Dermatophilaceae bacterium]
FFRDEPRTLTITAKAVPAGDGTSDLVARCTLTAERKLPGSDVPQKQTHFTGTVRLTQEPAKASTKKVSTTPADKQMGGTDVYTFYFHGPAYQVVEGAWKAGNGSMTRLRDPLPDNHTPAEKPLAIAPRLAELCFQTAGLWEAGRDGQLALPMRVERLAVLRDPATVKGGLFSYATQSAPGVFDCVVVDEKGKVVVRMDGYHSIAFPSAIPDAIAGTLRDTYAD